MSTPKFDHRRAARIHALRAGFRSLSDLARKVRITRSRLDDILIGRGPCDEGTAGLLARALAWPEFPSLLRLEPAPAKYVRRPRDHAPEPELVVRERSRLLYDVEQTPGAQFVVEYPSDLPRGVPLWAVVVIEQARSLGKRPTTENPTSPESWALTAAALVKDIALELKKDFNTKNSRR